LAADTLHALRLGMERSGRAALGHIRIGESERPALIEPYRGGLMISTLRTQDELASTEFVDRPDSEISSEMVEIAETLINRRAAEFDPAKLRDHFQDDLRKLVEEKVKGAPPAPAPAIEERRPRLVPSPEASPPTPEPPAPEPPVAESVVVPPPPDPEPPAPEPPPESVVAAPPPPPEPPAPEAPAAPETEAAAAPPPPVPELPLAPEPSPQPEPPPEPAVAAVVPPPSPEPSPSPASEPPPPAPEPAPAPSGGPHDVGAEILLHIMGLGDRRYVEPGWAGNPGSKRQIEALSIRPRDGLAASSIEFRVFAQEGRATAWVSNGNYAGTRGRNLPLTGFAVRPSGELGERIEIAYEGSFFEGGVVGPKRNGELCVSPVADDPLEAVRVTIIDQGAASGGG
jgi:hypothetical protein